MLGGGKHVGLSNVLIGDGVIFPILGGILVLVIIYFFIRSHIKTRRD